MLFEHLGHFVFRHRRAVIVNWCVLLSLNAVLAPGAIRRTGFPNLRKTALHEHYCFLLSLMSRQGCRWLQHFGLMRDGGGSSKGGQ